MSHGRAAGCCRSSHRASAVTSCSKGASVTYEPHGGGHEQTLHLYVPRCLLVSSDGGFPSSEQRSLLHLRASGDTTRRGRLAGAPFKEEQGGASAKWRAESDSKRDDVESDARVRASVRARVCCPMRLCCRVDRRWHHRADRASGWISSRILRRQIHPQATGLVLRVLFGWRLKGLIRGAHRDRGTGAKARAVRGLTESRAERRKGRWKKKNRRCLSHHSSAKTMSETRWLISWALSRCTLLRGPSCPLSLPRRFFVKQRTTEATTKNAIL